MRFLIRLLVNGLLVYAASGLLSGVFVKGYIEAVIVAVLLTIVNSLVRPIITVLTLPITILTLGLFMLIINGAMVLLVDWFLDGFNVDGWFWAILFSIVLAIFNLFFGGFDVGSRAYNTRRRKVV